MPQRRQEVSHPETRDATRTPGLHSSELQRAKTVHIKQPSGIPDKPVNPFAGAMERKTARLGRMWAESEGGRKYRLDMEAASAEWEQKQADAKQRADFEQSIAPVVAHAKSNLDAVRNDPSTTQAEVEQAEERLTLAQCGLVARYSAADKEWRQRQSEKIIAQAVEVDSQLNQLRQQRDALLQAAYEPSESEPAMVDVYYPPFYADPANAARHLISGPLGSTLLCALSAPKEHYGR